MDSKKWCERLRQSGRHIENMGLLVEARDFFDVADFIERQAKALDEAHEMIGGAATEIEEWHDSQEFDGGDMRGLVQQLRDSMASTHD